MMRRALGLIAALACAGACCRAGDAVVAVMGAFPPEMAALRAELGMEPGGPGHTEESVHGVLFQRGRVDGRGIVLFQAGPSVVNAAEFLQLALDRYPVSCVLFAGIAGGIDPSFQVGDVVVPENWAFHSEAMYLNADGTGGYVAPFPGRAIPKAHFGMIFPSPVYVPRDGQEGAQAVALFPVDPVLLAAARRAVSSLAPLRHLGRSVRVEVGGTGVSGSVLLANAEYREWVYATWQARCLDMESAAYAQVCFSNGKPLLVVRSLSDLAGGARSGALADPKGRAEVFSNAARVLHAVLRQLPSP